MGRRRTLGSQPLVLPAPPPYRSFPWGGRAWVQCSSRAPSRDRWADAQRQARVPQGAPTSLEEARRLGDTVICGLTCRESLWETHSSRSTSLAVRARRISWVG